MKLKRLIATAGLAAVLAIGVGTGTTINREAERNIADLTQLKAIDLNKNVIAKTADFTNKANCTVSTNLYDKEVKYTTDGFGVTVLNASNNNKSWACIKMGRKTLASVAVFSTDAAIAEEISVIKLDMKITTAKILNSIKLQVADAATPTVWQDEGSFTFTDKVGALAPELEVTTNKGTNKLYKISFDLNTHPATNEKDKKNGHIELNKVEFYTPKTGGVTGVEITPNITTVNVGSTQQYAYTVSGDASNLDATWSISDVTPVGAATLSETGLLTANEAGSCKITATSDFDNTKFAALTITLKADDFVTLKYTGKIAPQRAGLAFDLTGLEFTGVRGSGQENVIPHEEIVITPTVLVGGSNQKVTATIKDTTVSCEVGPFDAPVIKENTYLPIKSFADLNTGDIVVLASTNANITKVATRSINDKFNQLDAKVAELNGENLVIDDLTTNVAHYRVTKNADDTFSLLDLAQNTYLSAGDGSTSLVHSTTEVKLELTDGYRVGGTMPLIQVDNGQTRTERAIMLDDSRNTFKNYYPNTKPNKQGQIFASSYKEVKLYKLSGENKAVSVVDALTAWANYNLKMQDPDFKGDGTGACYNLYAPAKAALNALNENYPGAIAELENNADLVEAKARYEAWAKVNKDATPYDGVAFVPSQSALFNENNSSMIIVIVSISILSISLITFFAISKKRRLSK